MLVFLFNFIKFTYLYLKSYDFVIEFYIVFYILSITSYIIFFVFYFSYIFLLLSLIFLYVIALLLVIFIPIFYVLLFLTYKLWTWVFLLLLYNEGNDDIWLYIILDAYVCKSFFINILNTIQLNERNIWNCE